MSLMLEDFGDEKFLLLKFQHFTLKSCGFCWMKNIKKLFRSCLLIIRLFLLKSSQKQRRLMDDAVALPLPHLLLRFRSD